MRKLKSKNFIIPLLLALSGTLSAQTPVYSLDECMNLALKNNRALGAYLLKIDERKALASRVMELDKTTFYYGYDQANVAENGHPLRTLGVEQTFLFPTIHSLNNKMNRMEVTQAQLELQKQQLILKKKVASSYYSYQFLLKKQRYFNRIDSMYDRLNSMADTQLRLGDISELDKLNLQAKKQQSALEISKIAIEIQHAYAGLKSVMQTGEDFRIEEIPMKIITVSKPDMQTSPEIQQYRLRSEFLKTNVKAERQRLLPDISLGYFYGNNRFENARGYHGFQVGLGIPLYPGDQRSKIKANRIATDANELLLQNNLILLEMKYNNLKNELEKYNKTIDFYNNTGKKLSDEITRTATRSYESGEIDFYQLVLSLENALKLTLDYYEAVSEYNRIALEINYLHSPDS